MSIFTRDSIANIVVYLLETIRHSVDSIEGHVLGDKSAIFDFSKP